MDIDLVTREDVIRIENRIGEMAGMIKSLVDLISTSNEKLLTQTEAAKVLGIHPQTLYRYVQDGLITPNYVGSRPYYTQTILNDFKNRSNCENCRIADVITKK